MVLPLPPFLSVDYVLCRVMFCHFFFALLSFSFAHRLHHLLTTICARVFVCNVWIFVLMALLYFDVFGHSCRKHFFSAFSHYSVELMAAFICWFVWRIKRRNGIDWAEICETQKKNEKQRKKNWNQSILCASFLQCVCPSHWRNHHNLRSINYRLMYFRQRVDQ